MRRFLAFGVVLSIATVGFAQVTIGGQGPCPAAGKPEAAGPMVCPHPQLCDIVECPVLDKKVDECVNLALGCVKNLSKQDVFVTYLEICGESRIFCEERAPLSFGHVQGNEPQIPSGVIQPFIAAHLLSKEKSVSGEVADDLSNMLKHGDFEATNRIINYLSDTESGPELEGDDLKSFMAKRDGTNKFLSRMGFTNFNLNQKLWDGPPSASDLQLLGEKLPMNYQNSNRLATNQVAAFLCMLAEGSVVSGKASKTILDGMTRPVEQEKVAPLAGIVAGLPVGSTIANVNGFTYSNFNDAGVVTLPNGKRYVLVAFTRYGLEPSVFIPQLSKIIAGRLMTETGDDESAPSLAGRPVAGN